MEDHDSGGPRQSVDPVSQRFLAAAYSPGARSDKCRDVKQHDRRKVTNSNNVAQKYSSCYKSRRAECGIHRAHLIKEHGSV